MLPGPFVVLSPARALARGMEVGRLVGYRPRKQQGSSAMVETTILVVAGKGLRVPRMLKRVLQIAIAVGLTALVLLVVIVGNGLLVGRQVSLQAGINVWLAFIKRPDILSTMVLTAVVTVIFVYWQRSQERRVGGSSRAQS